MRKILLFVLGLGLIGMMGSCCGNTICECIGTEFSITFLDGNGNCNVNETDNLQIEAFENDVPSNNSVYKFSDCTYLFESFGQDLSWVISNDSLGINDTIRLLDISFVDVSDNGRDCCDCPAPIESVTLDVNGDIYQGNEITITY